MKLNHIIKTRPYILLFNLVLTSIGFSQEIPIHPSNKYFCENQKDEIRELDQFTVSENSIDNYKIGEGESYLFKIYLSRDCLGNNNQDPSGSSNDQFSFHDFENIDIQFGGAKDVKDEDEQRDFTIDKETSPDTIFITFKVTSELNIDEIAFDQIKVKNNFAGPSACTKLLLSVFSIIPETDTTPKDTVSNDTTIEIATIERVVVNINEIASDGKACLGESIDIKASVTPDEREYSYTWEKNSNPITTCDSEICRVEEIFEGDNINVRVEDVESGCDRSKPQEFSINRNNLNPVPKLFFKTNLKSIRAELSKSRELNWHNPFILDFDSENLPNLNIYNHGSIVHDSLISNTPGILRRYIPFISFPIIPEPFIEAEITNNSGCIVRDTLRAAPLIEAPGTINLFCPNTNVKLSLDIDDARCSALTKPFFTYFYARSPQNPSNFPQFSTCDEIPGDIEGRFILSLIESFSRSPSQTLNPEFLFEKENNFFKLQEGPTPRSGSFFLQLTYKFNDQETVIDNLPFSIKTNDVEAKIVWEGICEGQQIILQNRNGENLIGPDYEYEAKWEIWKDNSKIFPKTGTDIIEFSGSSVGNIKSELYLEEQLDPGIYTTILKIEEISDEIPKVCIEPDTQKLYVQPRLVLDSNLVFPYQEKFENEPNFLDKINTWVADGRDGKYSWERSDGVIINNPDLSQVNFKWQTENILGREQSYVIGPCLNLRNLDRPMMSMRILGNLNSGTDGVSFQVAEISENSATISWKTIGNSSGNGINWYNDQNIDGAPGDGSDEKHQAENPGKFGWSGIIKNDQNQWVDVSISLEQFKGKTIIPRIVLGSSLSNPEGYYFAFDSVVVRNKTRHVLFEYLSDSLNRYSLTQDSTLNQNNLIHYQLPTNLGATDNTYYANNSSVFEARLLKQGYPTQDFSRQYIDGFTPREIISKNFRFFEEENPIHDASLQNAVNLRSMEFPTFQFDNLGYNSIDKSIDISLKANSSISGEITIIVALVIQRWDNLEHVLIDLLPNSAGKYYPIEMESGEILSDKLFLDFSNVPFPETGELTHLIVFVQDINTREIYQSKSLGKFLTNSLKSRFSDSFDLGKASKELIIFPNPTANKLIIEWDELSELSLHWNILDLAGRTVSNGTHNRNLDRVIINTSSLSPGLFQLVLKGENISIQKRVLIVR